MWTWTRRTRDSAPTLYRGRDAAEFPRRRGLDPSADERAASPTDSVLAKRSEGYVGCEDPAVATAWIVLCVRPKPGVVCTARLLQAWPFALWWPVLSCCWDRRPLLFWLCGARPWPSCYGEDAGSGFLRLSVGGCLCAATAGRTPEARPSSETSMWTAPGARWPRRGDVAAYARCLRSRRVTLFDVKRARDLRPPRVGSH